MRKKLINRKASKKWLLTAVATALLAILLAQPALAVLMPYDPPEFNGWTTVQLTDTPPPLENYPAMLSGDGTKIAYSLRHYPTEGSNVYILDTVTATSQELLPLAAGDFDPSRPSISDDGSQVVFESVYYGSVGREIILANSNGLTELTDRNQYWADHPSISGDGSKVAYRAATAARSEIYIVNTAQGPSSARSVTPATGAYVALVNCILPTISGDGSKIAFYVINDDGSADIYLINSDGTSTTPTKIFSNVLPIMPKELQPLSLSYDGSKVVFYSKVDATPQVFVWDAENGVTQLTYEKSNWAPSISGDGKKIAFVSNRDNSDWPYTGEIYIMNADGAHQTRVTSDLYMEGYVPTVDYFGTKIAWHASNSRHDYQIYMATYSPTKSAEDLIQEIKGMDLPHGTENSLTQKLQNAIDSLNADKTIPAVNKLYAFIAEVQDQSGKSIPPDLADYLISRAQAIISSISA